jgi:HEPN domain-containing protein
MSAHSHLPFRLREARRWLRYAQEDLTTVQRLLAMGEVIPRHPAWLAQQAAEKALKAVLIAEGIFFPRTHDLEALHTRIPSRWRVRHLQVDLERLTEYAVEARYPGDLPDISFEEARAAVADAARIVQAVASEMPKSPEISST